MRVTQRVRKLVSTYETDNPGTKSALARILMEGKLGGTGRALILPIDYAFSKELVPKFSGADPDYHFQLAVDAGLSALTAPLEILEVAADTYAGSLPLILQIQAGEPFRPDPVSGSVRDALRLGCAVISCAVSPGGDNQAIADLAREAKSYGLAIMMWVAPADADPGMEALASAVGTASALGAHIVCVRVPKSSADPEPLSDRVRHIGETCRKTTRMLMFASNMMQDGTDLYEEVRGIRDGGAQGYILPPNSLYRPFDEALSIIDRSVNIYQGKA